VTVASSPKFAAFESWRGIKPQVLSMFTQQLQEDFSQTIERFLALQAMGSPSARQDTRVLKSLLLERPQPQFTALDLGLSLLADVDLRDRLHELKMPFLRIYGRLDGLVPAKIAQEVSELAPNSASKVFQHSSHAPFITEPDIFIDELEAFISSQ
jgi:pimeloyl-[acyl-carrier protein] methyl ester esterase